MKGAREGGRSWARALGGVGLTAMTLMAWATSSSARGDPRPLLGHRRAGALVAFRPELGGELLQVFARRRMCRTRVPRAGAPHEASR